MNTKLLWGMLAAVDPEAGHGEGAFCEEGTRASTYVMRRDFSHLSGAESAAPLGRGRLSISRDLTLVLPVIRCTAAESPCGAVPRFLPRIAALRPLCSNEFGEAVPPPGGSKCPTM